MPAGFHALAPIIQVKREPPNAGPPLIEERKSVRQDSFIQPGQSSQILSGAPAVPAAAANVRGVGLGGVGGKMPDAGVERVKVEGGLEGAGLGVQVKEAHVIFVVDISMSMMTKDGKDQHGKKITRFEAVIECCLDFVKKHLEQGPPPAGVRDLYSIVFFNDQV